MTLEEEVQAIMQKLRKYRFFMIALLIANLGFFLFVFFSFAPKKELRCQRLVLEGPTGETRAILEIKDNVTRLMIYGDRAHSDKSDSGNVALALGVTSGDPFLVMQDKYEKPRIAIAAFEGKARILVTDQNGITLWRVPPKGGSAW